MNLPPLFPLYPLTKGINSWDVQRAVSFARSVLDPVPELLPDPIRDRFGLPDAQTAINWIHEPEDLDQAKAAQRRYRFEEALITQLVLARRRAEIRALGAAARLGRDGGLLDEFDSRLPFTLTAGQQDVSAEIFADLC